MKNKIFKAFVVTLVTFMIVSMTAGIIREYREYVHERDLKTLVSLGIDPDKLNDEGTGVFTTSDERTIMNRTYVFDTMYKVEEYEVKSIKGSMEKLDEPTGFVHRESYMRSEN